MTAQEAFIIYKKLDNEVQACQVQPHEYINYHLKDERKLKIFQSLVESEVDVKKFFLANIVLNKEFFIDYYKAYPDKCMTLYYSWNEFLVKKRKHYFMRVIQELKKGIKLNLDDRDAFLEELPLTDYLLWSVLYPEDFELLMSLEDDWVKFNLGEYKSQMEFVKKVIRGHFALKNMKGYDKLREKALKIIITK